MPPRDSNGRALRREAVKRGQGNGTVCIARGEMANCPTKVLVASLYLLIQPPPLVQMSLEKPSNFLAQAVRTI